MEALETKRKSVDSLGLSLTLIDSVGHLSRLLFLWSKTSDNKEKDFSL